MPGRPLAGRAVIAARLSLAACALLVLLPVASRATRVALVASVAALFACLLVLCWRRPLLRGTMIAAAVLPALFIAWPARRPDVDALKRANIQALRRYEGARYVWGGEGPIGIDCSGLVRRGLVDALALRSLLAVDPGAARLAVTTWWRDGSARALGEGHAGMTRPVLAAESINALARTLVEPGDLAVTVDGVHVLAYCGDGEWIQADPAAGRVLTLRAPSPDSPWFQVPVRIVRWRVLDG